MEASERSLFLLEMFADLDFTVIEKIVQVQGPDASMETLVDQCLSIENAKSSGQSESEEKYHTSDYVDMVSLVPMSTIVGGNDDPSQSPSQPDISHSSELPKPAEANPPKDLTSVSRDEDDPANLLRSRLEPQVQFLRSNASLNSTSICLMTIIRVLQNLLDHPQDGKYTIIKLTNKAFHEKVDRLSGARAILYSAGFSLSENDQTLRYFGADLARVFLMKEILTETHANLLETSESPSGEDDVMEELKLLRKSRKRTNVQPSSVGRRSPERVKITKISRDAMAARVEQRLQNSQSSPSDESDMQPEAHYSSPHLPSSSSPYVLPPLHASSSSPHHFVGANASAWKQIQQIRAEKHQKWRNTRLARQRVFTMADIQKMREERENTAFAPHGSDNEMGKEALKYTNEFRAKHNLPPLTWSQPLANIGRVHSKDMADKKVPFSHEGFDERTKQYPFPFMSAGENLAMNNMVGNEAKVAVDGWIDSPGHRRNLLGNFSLCGIGVVRRADGACYLTQMLALR
eukprot:203645_1